MRRVTAIAAGVLALGTAAALAQDHGGHAGPGAHVQVGFSDYDPPQLSVLAGETVTWTNDSSRAHTVTADDDSFDSGRVFTGSTYAHRFDSVGVYPYHCTLHPFIRGQIDVRDLILSPPPAPGAPGRPFPIGGRSSLPAGTQVSIEGDTGDGNGFVAVTTATVGDDDAFSTYVTPQVPTAYRATVGTDSSAPIQVAVVDHRVAATVRRSGTDIVVDATVSPASPGQTVVLQFNLHERFGWWPQRTKRLDKGSRAHFRVREPRGVPVRVVLTLPDGATPLATSPVIRVKRAG